MPSTCRPIRRSRETTSLTTPPYHPGTMVPEAELRQTDAGLVPASTGWFVMNARDARWFEKPGQGFSLPLTGHDEYEAETFFPMLGMAIRVVNSGEPTTTYHWETEQEDFLVLAGEGLLIVEGEERPLRRWDFVHCPAGTKHMIVATGEEPCVIVAASVTAASERRQLHPSVVLIPSTSKPIAHAAKANRRTRKTRSPAPESE